MPTAHLFENEG